MSLAIAAPAMAGQQAAPDAQEGAPPPSVTFEYSDGYRTRAKIHKIGSFATLPLFATEAFLGQSLYSEPSGGKKDAHLLVAAASAPSSSSTRSPAPGT